MVSVLAFVVFLSVVSSCSAGWTSTAQVRMDMEKVATGIMEKDLVAKEKSVVEKEVTREMEKSVYM